MTDLHNGRSWTRRQFVQTSLMASAAMTVPAFLERSAFGAMPRSGATSSQPGVPEDRVLVVVQLAGGNDGLNTVVPFGDAAYYRARPGIAVPERDVLKLGRSVDVGLHPALEGLNGLYDDGLLSIVQGVGYPNPNRSHFKSMDIWQTADPSGVGAGWLGKYLDAQCHGSPEEDARAARQRDASDAEASASDGCSPNPAIAIGREAPLAMQGRRVKPVSFENEDLFRWTGRDLHPSLAKPYHELNNGGRARNDDTAHDGDPLDGPARAAGSNAEFLTRTSLDAQIASADIRRAVVQGPTVDYPRTQLGQQLAMVGAMIRAGLKTRIYYVSMGGFDTHAGQGGAQGSHARLLAQFADALRTFYADLNNQRNEGRVLTLTFSEFGRRVAQNGSNGTDHGAAAPLFLAGPMVRPGVVNRHPSLTDLDNGDLKYTTDFRSVYTSVLDDWLGADAEKVLGDKFRPARVLR